MPKLFSAMRKHPNKQDSGPRATIDLPKGWEVIRFDNPPRFKEVIHHITGPELAEFTDEAMFGAMCLQMVEMFVAGGVDLLAMCLGEDGEYPPPMSLMVTREPIALKTMMLRQKLEGWRYEEFRSKVPGYRSVREPQGLVVEYWLDPNDGRGVFTAQFDSEYPEMRDQLVDYFDAIVNTIRIEPFDATRHSGF